MSWSFKKLKCKYCGEIVYTDSYDRIFDRKKNLIIPYYETHMRKAKIWYK